MKPNKASLWLTTVLVLAGCPGDPDEKPQLSSVTVTCAPATVEAGLSTQCTASASDQDGNPFTISGYTWTSTNESVAKVDPTGKATTSTAGTATIRASAAADGVTQQGETVLTVTQREPTVHSAPITSNETWRAADNPHVVRGFIEVSGPSAPTLTLEAGVEILFDQDYELRVTNGALKALGTQAAPIRMVASQTAPPKGYWRGVVFAAAGSTSELNYVTLSGCGDDSGEGACIAMENQAAPVLRHVTVQNSGTAGVVVADDGSAFGTGSTALSVSGSQGYAVSIGANQAGTLPTEGTYTANTPNRIELRGNVSRTQTWPNPGIPYVVNDRINVLGDSPAVLTLSAGTVLRFGLDAALLVGDTDPGELIVEGTATSPVLFTADSDDAQPGHWRGVHLYRWTSGNSRISHATIEYAGAIGNVGVCGLCIYGDGSTGGARPVINNLVVQKNSSYGVWVQENGSFGSGSTALTSRQNGSYPIRIEPNFVGTIPPDSSFTDNGLNAVDIRPGIRVLTSQTWPNFEVPYVVNTDINVSSLTAKPTLTLAPGTELRFGQGFELKVGEATNRTGVLIAKGTAQAPIRIGPNAANPTKGYWRGMHFWQAEGSQIDHVIVTHAGATGSIGTGNVNVYREIGAFVTNSTFSDSSGCGITVSTGGYTGSTAVTTDFTLAASNNTFANNTGGAQCTN